MRQGYLANMLAEDGFSVSVTGIENFRELSRAVKISDLSEIAAFDAVILPVPVSRDGATLNTPLSNKVFYLFDLLESLKRDQLVLGGKISDEFHDAAAVRSIKSIDYLEREELSVLNAIPTAEGALEIAIHETTHTVFGSKCVVSGYGRIGKILSKLLLSMGAKVYVSARKCSDFAWIQANGCTPIHISEIKQNISDADIIFNTVPHMMFDSFTLSGINKNAVIIELASEPGGIDMKSAAMRGLKVINAQSLPGKTAPVSAAAIIKETILNIFREEYA